MRVISGIYKGRKLVSPLNNNVRPTTDKVKEAMFAILQADIKDAVVIDLFAGTGGLGIEALSRGAKKVYFCDNTPSSLDLIKENLSFVDRASYEVFKGDFSDCLRRFATKGEKADIIICDPPYLKGFYEKAFAAIEKYNVLAENGTIISERKFTDIPIKRCFTLTATHKYCETCLDVYKNYTKVAVTGTFDPFTNGHKYIVEKALEKYDFVYVVVLVNETKQSRYSVETRKEMIKTSLAEYKKRIKIDYFDGMTIDYCNENGIKCIYRGVRNERDEAYEKDMAEYNLVNGGIETVLIKAQNDISSTEVKRLIDENQDVSEYVNEDIIKILKRK